MPRSRAALPFALTLLAAMAIGWLPVACAEESAAEVFTKQIKPILDRACSECHGEKKQKGDLTFAGFTDFDKAMAARPVWTEVLERVQADEMPPEGAPPLSFNQRQTLMRWVRKLPADEVDCTKIASDRTQNFYRGHVMSRRLNRYEYDNTIRDLTGLDLAPGKRLPADGSGGEGFDTTGDTLFTSSLAIEKWLEAAEEVVGALLPDQTDALTPTVAAARQRLLIALPGPRHSPTEAATAVLSRFTRLAYRRPAESAEMEKLLALFERGWQRGDGFEAALRLPLKAVLVSPHFLFLVEPEADEPGTAPLAPLPLASRLSYFLWASMPDEQLLCVAESGDLLEPSVYMAQIHRMIRDPKARSLGERFAVQWLELDRLGGEIRPDPKRFPEFDHNLAAAMREEVTSFFNHLIQENRPLTELLDSDYTFANEALARIYDLDGVSGDRLRRVALKPGARGGLLGMSAIHAVTSYPLRTSPVLRGKWVLEVLLGDRVPPPPPDVPALKLDEHQVTAASLREQLEIHRKSPDCAGCHNRMDPLGFGLETFDVLGRVRTTEGGQPVDATGTLPGGETFSGPGGLRKVLLDRQDQILRHFVKKLAGYALGRSLNKFDDCIIRDSMKALKQNHFTPLCVLETIATSLPFRYRYHAKPESQDPS